MTPSTIDPPVRVRWNMTEDRVMTIVFSGDYPIGGRGNPVAIWMLETASKFVRQSKTRAVIVDLRDLSYRWGDMIECVYAISGHVDPEIRQATVVSDLNRQSLSTLEFGLQTSQDITSLEDIFDTIEAAHQYVTNS